MQTPSHLTTTEAVNVLDPRQRHLDGSLAIMERTQRGVLRQALVLWLVVDL